MKHGKLFPLIGTVLLSLAVVFAATSCKQNDDSSRSTPVTSIKSDDGKATLTLSVDKSTGKGTFKVDVPAGNYWVKGDFEQSGTNIILKNTIDSNGAKSVVDGTYPMTVVGTQVKVTIDSYTFDLTNLG